MKPWLLFSLILGVVIYLGYRIVRRKDPDVIAEADRVAKQEWADLQKRGFWRHLLSRGKFFFAFYLAGAFVNAWRTTGGFLPDPNLLAVYGAMAFGFTLLTSWLDWRSAADRAAEAQQRDQAANPRLASRP